MLWQLDMTGPRAPLPADPAEHPLRASLVRGDQAYARARPALLHLLRARDDAMIAEAVVARVNGLLSDLADRVQAIGADSDRAAILARLIGSDAVREHCQALALEWGLATRMEDGHALDPVLSPVLQAAIGGEGADHTELAMQALAAQARFAQTQRRMELPLEELPGEVLHAALLAGRGSRNTPIPEEERRARGAYREADTRLALLGRVASELLHEREAGLSITEAGVALWLTAVAQRSGQSRERIVFAAVDPHLGRLLLSLRAAGLAPGEAEQQVMQLHPDAELPRGLHDIGTREAAQWLAERQT